MVDKKVLEASTIGEAERFVEQWDSNAIELKPEAMKWTLTLKKGRFSTQKSNLADYISSIVASYKKIRTDALFAMESKDDMTKQVLIPVMMREVKDAAAEVVETKTIIESKKGFRAGDAIYKKIETLQDQISQLTTGINEWKKTAEEAIDISQKTNDKYDQLVAEYKILQEYGETLSPRFVQEAKRYNKEKTHPISRLEESEDGK